MWVLLVILAVPLIEIGLFVVVGGAIGLWLTLAWVVVTAGLGVILLKGMAMIGVSSLSRDMAEFSDARSPMAHRILVLLAAVCLILPGFFTDTIGLLLLIQPIRRVAIWLVAKRLKVATVVRTKGAVIDGEWRDASAPSTSDTNSGQPKR
ncbi:FxsA Protein affecting phage T7 exclusion by the F plasmid [Paracoccaceae bacterium]|jgi:UPF0716 protein FxsA